ncbi:MAG: winged helix-turn-helix transcriptional regulator [Beijerinckiaceae bacterium]
MPAKTDLSRLNCSLARALDAVGDWWTLLIVRDAFFGLTRFSDFQKSSGIARNILASRLEALVRAGILARTGTETRPLYELTLKGRALFPALVALMQWGDFWQSGGVPPVELTDEEGRPVLPIRIESPTGRIVTAETVRFRPGPGANTETSHFLANRLRAGSLEKRKTRPR